MNGSPVVQDSNNNESIKDKNRTYNTTNTKQQQESTTEPSMAQRIGVLPRYEEIKPQDEVFVEATTLDDDINQDLNTDGSKFKSHEIFEENGGGIKGDFTTHCVLCGSPYERPKILPCLHSFCLRCLQDYELRHRKKTNGNNGIGGDDDDDENSTTQDNGSTDELPCPQCSRIFEIPAGPVGGLETLPDHIFYSRLASVLRTNSQGTSPGEEAPSRPPGLSVGSETPELCSVCGAAENELEEQSNDPPEIARFACLDCSERLCADCARAHKKQTLSRGHNVLPLTDPMFTSAAAPLRGLHAAGLVEQLSVCGQHPREKVTLYCSDCSLPVCLRCVGSAHHAGHVTHDVTAVGSRGRTSLEEGLEKIYQRLDAFQLLRDSMAKQQQNFLQQVDEANAQIRQAADEMRHAVDMYEDQLVRETLAIRENTVQELAKVYEEVDDDYDSLNSLRELTEHLLAEGTDADVALLAERIRARRRQLESTNHDVSVCSVKFRPAPANKTNPLGKVAILDIDSSDPYIDSPSVISVIHGTESVAGVTLLDGELYIVRDLTPFVDVYNVLSFAPIRRLRLDGLRKPSDVTSSSTNQSLYVSDSSGHVYCLQPHGQILIRWQCDGEPNGLHVSQNNGNVLVTCYDSRLLKEFTSDGAHLRTIRLQQDMANPSHTILIDPDRFVICHGWESGKLHRVCYIDSLGRTTRTYGGSNGSGSGRIDSPARLALDPFGYVFVLDRNNDRVQLLSPNLVHVRDLLGRGHFGARQPRRMCLDAANGCLYVGMIDGRVIAFRILEA